MSIVLCPLFGAGGAAGGAGHLSMECEALPNSFGVRVMERGWQIESRDRVGLEIATLSPKEQTMRGKAAASTARRLGDR